MTLFLDTNVFLYAAGADHPLREPCCRLLRRVASGELDAATSSEVLQEILFVLLRRGQRRAGLALARDVAQLVPLVLSVGKTEIEQACALLDRHEALSVRDAVHAATALVNEIDIIVSADSHFDHVVGLKRLPPDALR